MLQKQKYFTVREIEVSMLIIQGKSTKEIAESLFISNKAINFHRSNIRRKLGITNSKVSLKSSLLDL
ncbi:helix-turn-helix transcriptional regulator [Acetobacterium wieringae]|uniref:Helix-turn-helix transcriptional regulator n=1 Tax=Acetobacterium wieringae TaxID=52694 RepID=A0ABY6HJH9_9FIRM|nr:helix-turn-helix transcriptional regulator [Acetobacterium wieringae]